MEHAHTLTNWFLGAMVLIFIIIIALTIWPYRTIDVDIPIKILTPTVEPGGVIKYNFSYCKHTTVRPTIYKQFRNDVLINLIPFVSAKEGIGCGWCVSTAEVPRYADTGVYSLRLVFDYEMNPLRHITKTFDTEEFLVVESNGGMYNG